jgi:hypothetical protein
MLSNLAALAYQALGISGNNLPPSSRTIKESISGSHRGQGHANVTVEKRRRSIEHSERLRDALIVLLTGYPNVWIFFLVVLANPTPASRLTRVQNSI